MKIWVENVGRDQHRYCASHRTRVSGASFAPPTPIEESPQAAGLSIVIRHG
jgi:hypothetical protein